MSLAAPRWSLASQREGLDQQERTWAWQAGQAWSWQEGDSSGGGAPAPGSWSGGRWSGSLGSWSSGGDSQGGGGTPWQGARGSRRRHRSEESSDSEETLAASDPEPIGAFGSEARREIRQQRQRRHPMLLADRYHNPDFSLSALRAAAAVIETEIAAAIERRDRERFLVSRGIVIRGYSHIPRGTGPLARHRRRSPERTVSSNPRPPPGPGVQDMFQGCDDLSCTTSSSSGAEDSIEMNAETHVMPGSLPAAAGRSGSASFSAIGGSTPSPAQLPLQAPPVTVATGVTPSPQRTQPSPPPPPRWPQQRPPPPLLPPTATARWLGETEEHCLRQMRANLLDAVRGNIIALASASPDGDRLGRLVVTALDSWQRNSDSIAVEELPQARELLTMLPMLRAAICITCFKREDQLKQTLPALCMFVARIRSARSQANPTRPRLQPASQQANRPTGRRPAFQSTLRAAEVETAGISARQPPSQPEGSLQAHRLASQPVSQPAGGPASRPTSRPAPSQPDVKQYVATLVWISGGAQTDTWGLPLGRDVSGA